MATEDLLSKTKKFNITVDPANVPGSFLDILTSIRPCWILEEVEYEESAKDFSKGLVNTMVKCYWTKDPKDAIMIRVKNKQFNEVWDITYETEIKCILYFHEKQCAPKIEAVFNNGFCYEFIHGEILSHERLKEDQIWKSIANNFAKFHAGNLHDGEKLTGELRHDLMMKRIWDGFPTELKDPEKNKRFQTELPKKEELFQEYQALNKHFLATKPESVLCHNDVRPENIIWNEESGKAHFVDFELMNYNYQTADLATHFLFYTGVLNMDASKYPSKEFQLTWLKYYLQNLKKYKTGKDEIVTDLELMRLYVQVQKHYLIKSLEFVVIGIGFDNNSVLPDFNIDLIGISVAMYKNFLRNKEEILNLEMPVE